MPTSYQQAYYSVRDSFPKWFGDDWQTAKKIFHEQFAVHHLNFLQPMAGAEDILSRLKSAGIRTGLISNKQHHFLTKEVSHLGWDDYFVALLGAGVAAHDKPHTAMMDWMREKLLLPQQARIYYVGDRAGDGVFARASGAVPVMVGAFDAAEWPDALRVPDLPALTQVWQHQFLKEAP